jgi:hypothetical protein
MHQTRALRAAQARGVSFANTADGVLKALTKVVVETALEEEMADHLGYDKHDQAGETFAAGWLAVSAPMRFASVCARFGPKSCSRNTIS